MGTSSLLSSLLSSGTSSSAVDLSSILEAAYGASSPGIDVTSAVNAAVTAARAPETAWENQAYLLQEQNSDLNTLVTQTTSLDNDVQALNSVVGPLSARTVTSSNSSIVSASAASGSTPGNHVVVVNNLATTASWTSGVFASSTTALPAGSFTITTGSGSNVTITTDGTQTLSNVASQINGDNLGVTASVITDATGSRLAIVSNTSGSAANFTVGTTTTGYGFSQAATGVNASLTVDGIAISSATNTVSGVVSGLTLNLLGAASGSPVTLTVAPDTSQAQTAISQFVSDYNTLISSLNTQFTFNGSSEGDLSTDTTVRNLQSQLLSALSYTFTPTSGTTTVPNLSSLGISVQNDGTLTLDTSALQSTLSNNFSDVQSFFQGSAANGFANTLDQELTSYISPGNGAFTVDLQSNNSQITDLQNNINDFETNYITPLQAKLQAEYSQAEILLQQLPTLTQQINTMLGNNNNNNG
jgi:flagellar hook-associated protein 2